MNRSRYLVDRESFEVHHLGHVENPKRFRRLEPSDVVFRASCDQLAAVRGRQVRVLRGTLVTSEHPFATRGIFEVVA